MAFAAKNQTNPAIIEATGYAPYIKARAERADAFGFNSKAHRRAQAIRAYWQRKHFLDDLSEYAHKHEVDLFRNQWECEADKKALYSRVRWEMNKVTSQMDEELEKRRARLADLFETEKATYMDHMGAVQEDPAERKERMLNRYTELKMQKEMERERIAKEKKDQQFKRNCEELRTLVSKKIQRETAEEGRQIMKEKEREMIEKNREDAMYAELWAKDREAKQLKETQEAEEKRKKDIENEKFIQDQILKNRLAKQKKLREKEHDAAVMEEQKRLAELEEKLEKEKAKAKKAQMKTELDKCTREKLKRRSKEVQEDLLQDLFFMKQIADDEEETAKCEKKRALMHEQKQYLKYLEDKIEAEAAFEKEVDRMYQEEVDKMWKKREKEWEEERNKRRQREQEVLREVQEQIKSNLEKSQKVQALNQLYAQKVWEEDAEDKRKAAEKLKLIRERNIENQKELLVQIKNKEEKLKEEKFRNDLELEALKREREENERKIQKLLSEMKIDNEHPYRQRAREICY